MELENFFARKKNLTSEMVAQKSSWHIKDSHNQNYCKKYQHTIVMWESIALEANNDLNFFSRLCQHLWPVTWDWPSQTTPLLVDLHAPTCLPKRSNWFLFFFIFFLIKGFITLKSVIPGLCIAWCTQPTKTKGKLHRLIGIVTNLKIK